MHDLIEKQHRTDAITRKRDEAARVSVEKSMMLRDLILDVARKEDEILKPITIEAHKQEW